LDYASESDLEKLSILKELVTPAAVLKAFYLKKVISLHEEEISNRSTLVARESYLGSLLIRCADRLCLRYLPRLYVDQEIGFNAYCFGLDEKPVVVVGRDLIHTLVEEEVVALLGHELGHIGCGHMLYHTLAEFILQGISLSASTLGIPLLEAPLRFALLSWRRESEISADRASLLAADSLDAVKSLLNKLAMLNRGAKQTYEALSEIISTHPHLTRRVALVEDYYRSAGYIKAKSKIERRNLIRKALLPICRFCGSEKPPSSIFCPKCGRSCV